MRGTKVSFSDNYLYRGPYIAYRNPDYRSSGSEPIRRGEPATVMKT